MLKNGYILLIFILCIPGCTPVAKKSLVRRLYCPSKTYNNLQTSSLSNSLPEQKNVTGNPPVTIWIHGTRLLPQSLFKNFFQSMPGLHHYQEIEKKYYLHRIAQILTESDPVMFPAPYFYLFGWSGKLSFKEREQSARTLYLDLKKVRDEYKKIYGAEPHITILAHSHGGNVALLLEQIKDPDDTTFFIDRLILLAVPVQQHTVEYCYAPLFGKIYSLYSLLDVLQVIDPQGLNKAIKAPLFSERLFPCHEKLEQVAIKVNDRSIMHMEFILPTFLNRLSAIIKAIDRWQLHSKASYNAWYTQEKCLYVYTKQSKKVYSSLE